MSSVVGTAVIIAIYVVLWCLAMALAVFDRKLRYRSRRRWIIKSQRESRRRVDRAFREAEDLMKAVSEASRRTSWRL